MALVNFRKETSERSDEANWAKALLIEKSGFYLESIEGCNQNRANRVTHLIERARVDFDPSRQSSKSDILSEIIKLEREDALTRKINFAKCYSLPLTYTLYCDENENVYLFNFSSLIQIDFVQQFTSYKEFANWIAGIKGWKSNKPFREIKDLPHFDKELRKAGTPWPTNIDSFICDQENNVIAILEFQNAKYTNVASHCNNDFFLCKMTCKNNLGQTIYHDDIRRWVSQEILRVQSNLRYFIITWSQGEKDFILKEVETVTIPQFPKPKGKADWKYINSYKAAMNKYVISGKTPEAEKRIADNYKTYNLQNEDGEIKSIVNETPLSIGAKTFPSIYYHKKELTKNNREALVTKFVELLNA